MEWCYDFTSVAKAVGFYEQSQGLKLEAWSSVGGLEGRMGLKVAAALVSLVVIAATLRSTSAAKEDCPVCNGALEKLFKTVEDKNDMVRSRVVRKKRHSC